MGTSLAYMTVSAAYRMTRPPLILGGLTIWWGYVRSMLARKKRYDHPEFRAYLRRYQWVCLLKGKHQATTQFEQDALPIWQNRNKNQEQPEHATAEAQD